jgi:sugar lactone lactonase YvrE
MTCWHPHHPLFRRHSSLFVAGLAALLVLLMLSACDQGSPATPAALATSTAPGPPTPTEDTPASATMTLGVISTDTATSLPSTATPTWTPAPPPSSSSTRAVATPLPTHTPAAPPPTATHAPASPPLPTQTRTQPPPTSTAAQASGKGLIEEISSGFGNPDDLVVAPSGDIIFGDFGNKAVNVISAGAGSPHVLAGGIGEPEGLVVTGDGAVIVADQATNRILEIDYQTGSVKLLRHLVNNTGQDGVDGLGLDPATGDILIADSPNGRLLRMSRDGNSLKTIATGFVRPTDAEMEADGNIVLVDEFGNAVYRLHADGSRTKLAGIYQPDDVVIAPDGSIYVNSLGGDIARIDPVTSKVHVLLSGLKLPHGLGIDAKGRLVIIETGSNRIFRLTP